MYLSVEQLHLWAEALAAMFEQGGGRSCIEEAIDLDREALQLCPPGNPKRSVLSLLAIHLCDRYNQFGATRDLEEVIILNREVLNFRPRRYTPCTGAVRRGPTGPNKSCFRYAFVPRRVNVHKPHQNSTNRIFHFTCLQIQSLI
ncbi:hypothetical protein HD554DRAFT_2023062 [Boletus coccyginus]|nr:hypothetical protein HD554DRAFT_2023062 [Boletus coccyginus]